jgi:hypothetical protein
VPTPEWTKNRFEAEMYHPTDKFGCPSTFLPKRIKAPKTDKGEYDGRPPGNNPASRFFLFEHRVWRGKYDCACRKLNPGISVMESAQDWATKNVPGAIDGARDRCIFFQG